MSYDFKYKDYTIYIDVDYSTVYSNNPCECSDICRCSTIDTYNITDVIVSVTRKEGTGKKVKTVKDEFLSNQVYNIIHPKVEELVDINIVNGYYGQEIYRTYHKDAITTIVRNIIDLYTTNNSDKLYDTVMNMLLVEYGYVAPAIKNTTKCETISIKIEDMPEKLVNFDKFNTIKRSVKTFLYDYAKDYSGVLLQVGKDKYFLVDGHHRVSNALLCGVDTLQFYVLS